MRQNLKMRAWLESEAGKHRCQCGCGRFVVPTIDRWYRDRALRFVSGHQNRGKHHPNFKGGEVIAKGYRWVLLRGHPRSTPRGYVKNCWLIAEKHLGRFLLHNEHVHHRNGDKLDDHPQNLVVLEDRVHHQGHSAKRKRDANGKFS